MGCDAKVVGFDDDPNGSTGAGGDTNPSTGGGPVRCLTPTAGSATGKVDLLLMVDHSHSMQEKPQLLAQSLPKFLGWLLHPPCVDANGTPPLR